MSAATARAQYPIRAVARLTGLGIDTLRAWERRYAAVTPHRDERGRLYSEADIARLRLLREAVAAGHSIGRIAPLSDKALRALAIDSRPAAAMTIERERIRDTSAFRAALEQFDTAALDQEFSRLAASVPPTVLVCDVLLPLIREVGQEWTDRAGAIAQEHLISATLRHLLGSFLRVYAKGAHTRARLLFTTPSGDRHEIGTLAAAMLAASNGFGIAYLGPDLPASEIAAAAKHAGARVVVLGMTFITPGEQERDLRSLARMLPSRTELWIGGPGAEQRAALFGRRALVLETFDDYLNQLARLRDAG